MTAVHGQATLDLDRLVAAGIIDHPLAAAMSRLSIATGSPSGRFSGWVANILYILGALAAATGVILLKPTAATGLVIALVCLGSGVALRQGKVPGLEILSLALGIGSAFGLVGWFAAEFGSLLRNWHVGGVAALVFASHAVLFRSRVLAAFTVAALASALGSGAAYWHASYGVSVSEPFFVSAVFGALSALGVWGARTMPPHPDWPSLVTVFARTSIVMAHLGLWVGSLWGDGTVGLSETVFSVAWAVAAFAQIVVGMRMGDRYVAVTGVVFFVINASTQYFEAFQFDPFGLVLAGVVLVGIAVATVRLTALRGQATDVS